MSDQLRVGIAGTGFIGGIHARAALRAGATLVGVADANQELADSGAARLRAGKGYSSAEEMLADDSLDVIHVCTPNHTHLAIAKSALDAGKHVICEKPLALDLAGAEELVAAAEASDRQAAVPFVYRYHPSVREARDRVASGKTGDIRLLHGHYLQDWLLEAGDDNWRVDSKLGGASRAFADIGSHWCDLIEFVSGHRITHLAANMMTAHAQRQMAGEGAVAFEQGGGQGEVRTVSTEDAAVIQFRTDKGAIGSAVISQVSAGRKNRLWFEIDGANEALAFDQEEPERLWVGTRDHVMLVPRDPALRSADAARFSVTPAGHPQGWGDCFDNFIGDFYAAIAAGSASDGQPRFADGLRAARITDAVLASAREEDWVEVATQSTEVPA